MGDMEREEIMETEEGNGSMEPAGADISPDTLRILEALLFASEELLSVGKLKGILPGNPDARAIRKMIDKINVQLQKERHPFEIVEIGGGYQFRTVAYYHPWVRQIFKEKAAKKLSVQALECLAIIAYKQPLSKAEIEAIRGVVSDGAMKTLLERKLVTICGRSEKPGRPLLYGTTQEFLKYFGLNKIDDLPRIEEFEAIAREKIQDLSIEELEKSDIENTADEDTETDTSEPIEVAETVDQSETAEEAPEVEPVPDGTAIFEVDLEDNGAVDEPQESTLQGESSLEEPVDKLDVEFDEEDPRYAEETVSVEPVEEETEAQSCEEPTGKESQIAEEEIEFELNVAPEPSSEKTSDTATEEPEMDIQSGDMSGDAGTDEEIEEEIDFELNIKGSGSDEGVSTEIITKSDMEIDWSEEQEQVVEEKKPEVNASITGADGEDEILAETSELKSETVASLKETAAESSDEEEVLEVVIPEKKSEDVLDDEPVQKKGIFGKKRKSKKDKTDDL